MMMDDFNLSIEFLAIFAIGIPAALLGFMQFMVSRYGSGSKALALAVDMQATINSQYKLVTNELATLKAAQIVSDNKIAEERGGLNAKIQTLADELEVERKNNKKLTQEIAIMRTNQSQELAKLKTDSDEKIAELSRQLEQVKNKMDDYQKRLEQAEADKKQLADEKSATEKQFAEERLTLEARVDKLLANQTDIKRDMDAMKSQYEKQIDQLNQQIMVKDAEIIQLKSELENKNEKPIQGNDVVGDSVGAGESDSSSKR